MATYFKSGQSALGVASLLVEKTGTAISDFTAKGADAVTWNRQEIGISPRTGSGADVDTATETGIGIMPRVEAAAAFKIVPRSGTAISAFTGRGPDVDTFNRKEIGISQFVVKGVDAATINKSGNAISAFTGGGIVAGKTVTKSGTAISAFTGTASNAITYAEKTNLHFMHTGGDEWGAWVDAATVDLTQTQYHDLPWDDGPNSLAEVYAAHAGAWLFLIHFGQPPPWRQAFDTNAYEKCYLRGAVPYVYLGMDVKADGSPLAPRNITANTYGYDTDIVTYARAVKNWGRPCYLVPFSEMNGSWFNYGIGKVVEGSANTAAEIVAAWQHVVDIFNAQGVTNVIWTWNPNIWTRVPTSPADNGVADPTNLYPGDSYVDAATLDGFNWGSNPIKQNPDGNFWTFDQLFLSSYNGLDAIVGPGIPLGIGSVASTEIGGDKAAWITDMFAQLNGANYSRVQILIWFNNPALEGPVPQQRMDWPIESSQSAQDAFKVGIGDSRWARRFGGPAGFTALGADTVTVADSGTAFSTRTGSGSSVPIYAKTGIAISDREFTGKRNKDKTGIGISPRTGGGASVKATSNINIKSGIAVMGTVVNVYVKSGIAISQKVVSGSATKSKIKSGIAFSQFTSDGSSALIYSELKDENWVIGLPLIASQFLGGSGRSVSGSETHQTVAGTTYNKAGTAIAFIIGSGADVNQQSNTGSGISPRTGGGADALTLIDTGSAIVPFTGGGADATTRNRKEIAIAPFTGGGAKIFNPATIYVKSGTAFSDFIVFGQASKARITVPWPQTGSFRTGQGVGFTNPGNVTFDDNSYATANVVQGGTVQEEIWGNFGLDAVIPTGSRVTAVTILIGAKTTVGGFVGVRGYVSTVAKPASFTLNPLSTTEQQFSIDLGAGWTRAQLLDGVFEVGVEFTPPGAGTYQGSLDYIFVVVDFVPPYVDTGIGISPRTGGGAKSVTRQKKEIAISARTGGGVQQYIQGSFTYIKSGIAIAPLVASGDDATTKLKSGFGDTDFTGGGADSFQPKKSGTPISVFTGSGSNNKIKDESGAAISDRTGRGADVSTFTRKEIAISLRTGHGADSFNPTETGITVSSRTGSGADETTWSDTGKAIAPFTGGGSYQTGTFISKTGTAISAFTGRADRTISLSKTGQTVLVATGRGADAYTPVKTGLTISARTGSGFKNLVFSDTGTAIAPLSGSGTRNAEFDKTGTPVSPFSGGATRQLLSSREGTASFIGIGSGFDIVILNKSGEAEVEFTGGGQSTVSGSTSVSGIAITENTGQGFKQLAYGEIGKADSTLTASAEKFVIYDESGSGVSARTVSGVNQTDLTAGNKHYILVTGFEAVLISADRIKAELLSTEV